jgi:hypothetical protein
VIILPKSSEVQFRDIAGRRKEKDNKNPKFLYCTLCDPDGPEKPYGSNISSNIRAHLRIIRKIVVENVIGKI